MASRKVFIMGSGGYLGGHLGRYYRQQGWAVFESKQFMMRFENRDHVRRVLGLLKPDRLIQVCRLMERRDGNQYVRALDNLVEICEEQKTQLIYISSDLVFGGRGGPYGESRRAEGEDIGDVTLASLERRIFERYPEKAVLLRVPRIWSENMHPGYRQMNPLAEVYAALDGESMRFRKGIQRGLLHWQTLAKEIEQIEGAGTYHFREMWEGDLYETALFFADVLGADRWLIQQHILPVEGDEGEGRDFDLEVRNTEKVTGVRFMSTRERVGAVLGRRRS